VRRPCEPRLFLPFRVSVPLERAVTSVSSPRLVQRSRRISRTPLSWWLLSKGYGTYPDGSAFRASSREGPEFSHELVPFAKPLRTPPHSSEAMMIPHPHDGSAFALVYILSRRSCRLLGAFIISPLPSMLKEELPSAGPLRSMGITPLHHYYQPLRHPLAFDRFPRFAGSTVYLAPPISRRDEEGFSSFQRVLVTVPSLRTPPEQAASSSSLRRPVLPSPFNGRLGFRG
jgi:hypothetical protein